MNECVTVSWNLNTKHSMAGFVWQTCVWSHSVPNLMKFVNRVSYAQVNEAQHCQVAMDLVQLFLSHKANSN